MLSLAIWASLLAHMIKNLPAVQETRFDLWVEKIPRGRKWQPTPVFLPGESCRQRSLVGYSLCGHKRVGHDWVQVTFLCPSWRYELLKPSIRETAPYSTNLQSRYIPQLFRHFPHHPPASRSYNCESEHLLSEIDQGPQSLHRLLRKSIPLCNHKCVSHRLFYG